MVTIKRADRARWNSEKKAARVADAKARGTAPVAGSRNIQTVLDLGNLRFFTFRGRAYGVPPVPYADGLRLQSLWAEALGMGETPGDDQRDRYQEILGTFTRLAWRLCRPVGRLRRALRAVGLHRNPFAVATEQEVAEIVGFMLGCRTMSSVGFPNPNPAPRSA